MICTRCLPRSLRISRVFSRTSRCLSTPPSATPTSPRIDDTPAATSTSAAQPFPTPHTPSPDAISLGANLRPKSKDVAVPVSMTPAGTVMKGLNYFKGKNDPVALNEEEYPEWLWRCLDVKNVESDELLNEGDEFAKSKKLRRKAAKARRKYEDKMALTGEEIMRKIPLHEQSIDLPGNEEGSLEDGMKAQKARQELRAAMRSVRRKGIKEANYLKSV
ncbi:hypothetical protein B7494_g4285 [Chlorociboria aeruginascens]|nr:hypothetical protein B7494_g4285 [Chlorociboria aeruginascens]